MKPTLWMLALAIAVLGGCAPAEGESSTPTNSASSAATSTTTGSAPTDKPAETEQKTTVSIVDRKPADGEEVGVLETGKGRIVVMFFPDKAPKHVEQFKKLANAKFWDGTRFHRCIPGFMIQGGDPNSKDLGKADRWGTGGYTENGKEVTVPAEFNDVAHKRGILSAARSMDPNSASSQFFLMHQDAPSLDGQYSAYGKIVEGQDVVDAIVTTGDAGNNGAVNPDNAVVLKSVRIVKWPIK